MLEIDEDFHALGALLIDVLISRGVLLEREVRVTDGRFRLRLKQLPPPAGVIKVAVSARDEAGHSVERVGTLRLR